MESTFAFLMKPKTITLVDYARYNENFVLVVTSSCCIRWDSMGYQGPSPWLVSPFDPGRGEPRERVRLAASRSDRPISAVARNCEPCSYAVTGRATGSAPARCEISRSAG